MQNKLKGIFKVLHNIRVCPFFVSFNPPNIMQN